MHARTSQGVAGPRLALLTWVTVAAWAAAASPARAQNTPGYFPLTSPASGFVVAKPMDGVFTWQPSAGATKYFLEMLPEPNTDWSAALKFETPQTHKSPIDPDSHQFLWGKQVTWRVRACNAANACVINTGGTRSVRIPLVPAYAVEPLDGSISGPRPTFRWRAVTGAQFYKVVFNGSIITPNIGVPGNPSDGPSTFYEFTPTSDLSGTSVSWHVQACATIGGSMLCGEAFNEAQKRRLSIGQQSRRAPRDSRDPR